jgi:hypothetical protein
MQLVTDLIEPQVLIDFVRQYDNEVLRPEAQWTLDRWLPNRQVRNLKYRIRKGAFKDVNVAEYRAFDTPAVMTGRQGTSYIEGSLGPVSRQIPLSEEEILQSDDLLADTDDPIIRQIYEDSAAMIRSVQGRIELARGDLIDDGSVTIAENGLALTANFNRHADMRKVAATVWTNPAATILSDLLGWVEDYSDHNGFEPGSILMPRTRVASLALNTEMRSYASANGTTPTRLNRATIDAIFAEEGLPPIEISDEIVTRNDVRTRVLPLDKVYLMPPAGAALGNTFYGVTAEARLLRSRGLIDAEAEPGLVAVVTITEHPVQRYTVGTGIALPAMPNADYILDADVAA